ncbi:MAG: hypothetical protein ACRDJP_12945 [Actinomycetota bacterium]
MDDRAEDFDVGRFAVAFQRFLERVHQLSPAQGSPGRDRAVGHLGTEPDGLPSLAEPVATSDLPNLQLAIDALLTFHRVPPLTRSDVILPEPDLVAIEQHTVAVSAHAEELRAPGRHLKRGLLLFGPPGTGKTLSVDQAVEIKLPDVESRRRLFEHSTAVLRSTLGANPMRGADV